MTGAYERLLPDYSAIIERFKEEEEGDQPILLTTEKSLVHLSD